MEAVRIRVARIASIYLLALLICSAQAVAGASEKVSLPANLLRLPLIRQATNYTCGVAALQSILAYYGEDLREDTLAKELRADRRHGTRYRQIVQFAKKRGYEVEVTLGCSSKALKDFIDAGKPTLVLIQAWPNKAVDFSGDWNDGHYVVAVGYDQERFYFMDPSTVAQYAYVPFVEFEKRWHDVDGRTKLQHFAVTISKHAAASEFDSAVPLK